MCSSQMFIQRLLLALLFCACLVRGNTETWQLDLNGGDAELLILGDASNSTVHHITAPGATIDVSDVSGKQLVAMRYTNWAQSRLFLKICWTAMDPISIDDFQYAVSKEQSLLYLKFTTPLHCYPRELPSQDHIVQLNISIDELYLDCIPKQLLHYTVPFIVAVVVAVYTAFFHYETRYNLYTYLSI
ncbi:uncharacterized protein KNAG_0F01520 [Huiozyma naganishii CBS 8797]|uniref:Protein PBN1 n=1 Tax=Huiozyma naganishii (strain ATCC MYA-139 / BCRC 22969 / CBS 8797 / KCTC 17520 / NBRC 10181 / NCYC 3082 / Yp74L-3) TaxID=1071383 RepID=J7R7H2_HUIN7|nr:hypothetical protein KNAG_0F01520 [Kazachstania naganishii CBS 8797]CCK70820.1 hypothetical protein KNAG_0F01520 [Kazachstania naganishii CBS 8797]